MNVLSVTQSVNEQIAAQTNNATTGINPISYSQTFQSTFGWTFGTGAGFANQEYVALIINLADGANQTLTLSSFTNVDQQTAQTLTLVKSFKVELLANVDGSTPANKITVGNAGTHPWPGFMSSATTTFTVYLGGVHFEAVGGPGTTGLPASYTIANNGATVTAGSADQLKITNSDGTGKVATIRVTITGEL